MKPSRRIPVKVKKTLLNETSGKCANPGCPNSRVEFHHIQEWAIVQSHNKKDMIAICPACHDAAHHGTLKITEKTLYEWKEIIRKVSSNRTNIYIEPGSATKLLIGSLAFKQGRPGKTTILNIANDQHLSFDVEDDFLIISALLKDQNGETLVKISHNNITSKVSNDLKIEQRPGRFRITTTTKTQLLPAYALFLMRQNESSYADGDVITVIDIQVIKPGLAQVDGFWSKDSRTVIATPQGLNFMNNLGYFRRIHGQGEDTIIICGGSINDSIFNLT